MWRQGSSLNAFKGLALRRALTTQASASPKKLASLPLRFSLEVPKSQSISSDAIFTKLKTWPSIANQHGDDAAVVLATPDFARRIIDDGFMSELASVLAGSEHRGEFHVLGAAVDHVAPPIGSYQPFQGISVMRGSLERILPNLWEQSPPKAREDADTAPAMIFGMGRSLVTVPGANTTFQNQKDFTMIASHFDLSSPQRQVSRRLEKTLQHISVPTTREVASISDLGLWAPLLPVTQPREVTASFGNIIKGVKVNGVSIPASTELEEAVEKAFKNIPNLAESGPMGIWAVVVPEDVHDQVGPYPVLHEATTSQELVNLAARHFENLYARGARVYQILSGGGGWGAKKGLLSLDPQRTHFALSEEESLMRFMGSMDASDFAPLGAHIQFFTPLRASSTSQRGDVDAGGVLFGVHDAEMPARESKDLTIHPGLFGALSNKGIFTSDSSMEESKLSVPNSRVYLLESEHDNDSWASGLAGDSAFLLMSDSFGRSGTGPAGAEGAAEAATGGGIAEGILEEIDIV